MKLKEYLINNYSKKGIELFSIPFFFTKSLEKKITTTNLHSKTRNNPFHLKIKSTTSNATGVSLIMRIQSQREDRLPQEKWLDLS